MRWFGRTKVQEEPKMAVKLTWDDLIIQDIDPDDVFEYLKPWAYLVQGEYAPVFMSMFGDWFLRRRDGSTDELSVLEGTCNRLASTPEEFLSIVNTPEWQEVHLLSYQVWQLHRRGLIPKAGQCYALTPHPALTGKIDIDRAMVVDICVWQSICAQILCPEQE